MKFDHLPRAPGIYAIVNVRDGKRYVGSSANLYKRASAHVRALTAGKHPNERLQRAFALHTREAFRFEAVELCEAATLIEREQFHIDALRAHDASGGYNLRPTADRGIVSEATKAKIAATIRGTKRGPLSAEHRAKLSAAHKGKKLKPHVIANLAAISKTRIRSPEERAKISAAKMGHVVSAHARAKMSAAKGGCGPKQPTPKIPRIHSPETRAKIRATLLGHEVNEQTRAKLRAALLGKPSPRYGRSATA